MIIYFELFRTFFKIGLFSFGGGYAILAMINQEVVLKNAWITHSQFMDIVAISQMTPGPIAINAATFIGYQKGGFLGSVISTLGVIFPSLIVMTLITLTYIKLKNQPWFKNIFRKLRLLSLGLIAAAFIMIAGDAFRDLFSVLVFTASFIASWKFKLNPFYLLIGAAVIGIALG